MGLRLVLRRPDHSPGFFCWEGVIMNDLANKKIKGYELVERIGAGGGEWLPDEVLAWIGDNRYVRELTCAERTLYRIVPACEADNPVLSYN
jgi:hypothetical protein